MGNDDDIIRARFPQVLAVTGAQQLTRWSMRSTKPPPIPTPISTSCPPNVGGIKLTPRPYSY